jgi:hypothetical protein
MIRDVLCPNQNTNAMKLSFNSNGYLHKTIELTLDEFEQHFGTTELRKQKIKNALRFFKIFRSCGCAAVYIDGSFVSTCKNPADIDLCFDFTSIDDKKLRKEFPEFFGSNRINKLGEIRRDLKCHIFTFDNEDTRMFEYLQCDRDGNRKGLIKISLKNEYNYD